MTEPDLQLFFEPVTKIFRLKSNSAQALARLNIDNLRDLLFYIPYSFQVKEINPNLANLRDQQLIQTQVTIQDIKIAGGKSKLIQILAQNDTGSILLVFFNSIPQFIFQKLKIGSKHIISGRVNKQSYYPQIIHPDFIFTNAIASNLEPIYHLTYGITNRQIYSYIIQALDLFVTINKNKEQFLENVSNNLHILHLYKVKIHPPEILNYWSQASSSLAKYELFINQLLLKRIRVLHSNKIGYSFPVASELQQSVLDKIKFELTTSQQQVIEEIAKDQLSNLQMMRLLQGDVGSGKTLVALLSMLNVVNAQYQAVLMVPTELLAHQHHRFFLAALSHTNIKLALLTGKTTKKERKYILSRLELGDIQILIGTHALFQEKVKFHRLGYIVIDEQHRFGVSQRLALVQKSSSPDLLIMSATPIPRSLTLTMFNDMVISKLTGKPKAQIPIITTVTSISRLDAVITAIDRKIAENAKIYWICPLISQKESEQQELTREPLHLMDVDSRFMSLQKIYSTKVAYLHGKMKEEEKEQIMNEFSGGHIQILVATTVIEVGIDVPDATLIIIENAEKFGLAQLHQLRGRVGRSNKQSYCIMLYNPRYASSVAKKRLETIRTSSDGFYIAEQDLLLRGSGEILGAKQSGGPRFFFADLTRDKELLDKFAIHTERYDYARESGTGESDIKALEFRIKLFTKGEQYYAS